MDLNNNHLTNDSQNFENIVDLKTNSYSRESSKKVFMQKIKTIFDNNESFKKNKECEKPVLMNFSKVEKSQKHSNSSIKNTWLKQPLIFKPRYNKTCFEKINFSKNFSKKLITERKTYKPKKTEAKNLNNNSHFQTARDAHTFSTTKKDFLNQTANKFLASPNKPSNTSYCSKQPKKINEKRPFMRNENINNITDFEDTNLEQTTIQNNKLNKTEEVHMSLDSKLKKNQSNTEETLAEDLEEFLAIQTMKKLLGVGKKIWIAEITKLNREKRVIFDAKNFVELIKCTTNNSVNGFLAFNLYKHLNQLYIKKECKLSEFYELLKNKPEQYWFLMIQNACIIYKTRDFDKSMGLLKHDGFMNHLLKSIKIKVSNISMIISYYHNLYKEHYKNCIEEYSINKIFKSVKHFLNESLIKCSRKLTKLEREV